MTIKTDLSARFETLFANKPEIAVRAPGRVNLIGEHTDYNDGFVLPCAIDFAAHIVAAPNRLGKVRVFAADYGGQDEFDLAAPIGKSSKQWANYIRGVVWAMAEHGYTLPHGLDMAVGGNVPQGAGLSSSAALEVAVARTLQALSGWKLSETDLAKIAQYAENRFVGCQCGIMDQLVSARGQAGHAVLIDCRTLACEAVPMPDGLTVMIIHSHVKRGLVDSEYNTRRRQCEEAAAHFGVPALRDLDLAAFEAGKAGLDPTVARRARYIIEENARTLAAAAALRRNDTAALSRLMAESHAGMRDEFDITHPAVDTLVELVNDIVGTRGGVRMTGGGFGGCVVALVPHDMVEAVRNHLAAHYQAETGLKEEIFVCRAQDGVSIRRL
ncbi:galactokinase [Neisseria leonii]|uniref:Galactokinase n=1 Tax=Neisseria leonii TaxID=2995413 RepID=A0A9X4DZW1_9NEIS|nr:galactokinase [Neisseria sp. 51.81]MDD9326900.1 galactokinase [Neisseria sp. 51.81]